MIKTVSMDHACKRICANTVHVWRHTSNRLSFSPCKTFIPIAKHCKCLLWLQYSYAVLDKKTVTAGAVVCECNCTSDLMPLVCLPVFLECIVLFCVAITSAIFDDISWLIMLVPFLIHHSNQAEGKCACLTILAFIANLHKHMHTHVTHELWCASRPLFSVCNFTQG